MKMPPEAVMLKPSTPENLDIHSQPWNGSIVKDGVAVEGGRKTPLCARRRQGRAGGVRTAGRAIGAASCCQTVSPGDVCKWGEIDVGWKKSLPVTRNSSH
jgi:hypothetical protein